MNAPPAPDNREAEPLWGPLTPKEYEPAHYRYIWLFWLAIFALPAIAGVIAGVLL